MNIGIVRYVLGRLLILQAGFMLLPVIIGLIYNEGLKTIGSFLIVIAFLLITGISSGIKKPKDMSLYTKEGLVIASLSWFLLSFFGSIPFILSGEILSPVDAFFETTSGFTTTGASILENIEEMSKSMLFWRSFTHLIGGMGVLVFALALLPNMNPRSVNIMKAEVPGPVFGKLVSKLRDTARILYVIYLSLTAILFVLLLAGGTGWFSALVHSFATAGTGGFSIHNSSIAHYDSAYIQYVLGAGMLAFGINFNLYYLILIRQAGKFFKNEEIKWYFTIVIASVVLIAFNIHSQYDSFSVLIRDSFFAVSSIITTTGFSTADFGSWPLFSQVILMSLMFFGACAGSTGGGLKISRVGVIIKSVLAEITKSRDPGRMVRIKYSGSSLDKNAMKAIVQYFIVYIAVMCILVFLMAIESPDFTTAFSAVAANLNNIGPGLGGVGPSENYAEFSDFSKIILSISMVAGRLELYPVLILFLPSTWKKRG